MPDPCCGIICHLLAPLQSASRKQCNCCFGITAHVPHSVLQWILWDGSAPASRREQSMEQTETIATVVGHTTWQ